MPSQAEHWKYETDAGLYIHKIGMLLNQNNLPMYNKTVVIAKLPIFPIRIR
jgi:hypothetical protein